MVYGLLAEKCPKSGDIKRYILRYFDSLLLFHEYILPKLNLTPQVKDLPKEERISELLGHIV